MRGVRHDTCDIRVHVALSELQATIQRRYPDAVFGVFRGEDPCGLYLRAIIDVEAAEEVMDLIVDQLYEIQVEQYLPIYVIPVPSPARALAGPARERESEPVEASPTAGA